MRKFFLDLILFAVFFVVASELLLRPLPVWEGLRSQPLNADHPYPSYEPNARRTYSSEWNFRHVQETPINNIGVVNDQDYASIAPRPMLAVIGDSFVEARAIPFSESLTSRIRDVAATSGRVYSFPCADSPLGSYLKLAELAVHEYGARSLVFVVVDDDILRALAKYAKKPRCYHFFPGARPGELELRRVDFRRHFAAPLVEHSQLLRYLLVNLRLLTTIRSLSSRSDPPRPSSPRDLAARELRWKEDGVTATTAFLDELDRILAGRDIPVAFLVDAVRAEIYRGDLPPPPARVRQLEFAATRADFCRLVAARGHEILDPTPSMARTVAGNRRIDFEDDHHWNSLGHQIAAETVVASRTFAATFPASAASGPQAPTTP